MHMSLCMYMEQYQEASRSGFSPRMHVYKKCVSAFAQTNIQTHA